MQIQIEPKPDLSVTYHPISELVPYPRNARWHTKHQIRQIAASIKEFGFTNPGLSKDQVRAYILADNRLAEKAGWDPEILAIELQELIALDLDFDVTVTGFEIPEIDLILQDGAATKEAADVLHPEDLSGPAVSRSGDLWRLGKHRVLCGSGFKAAIDFGGQGQSPSQSPVLRNHEDVSRDDGTRTTGKSNTCSALRKGEEREAGPAWRR